MKNKLGLRFPRRKK